MPTRLSVVAVYASVGAGAFVVLVVGSCLLLLRRFRQRKVCGRTSAMTVTVAAVLPVMV